MSVSARVRAAGIIRRWLSEGVFPDHQLEREKKDRAFLMETVYGAVKWKGELEWILGRLADRPPSDPLPRAHLLIALYQLFHLDQTPSFAVVHETVEAVKKAGGHSAGRFINAVLRRALREQPEIRKALEQAPAPIRYSHPELLIRRWETNLGWNRTEEVLNWNNGRPELFIRIQRSRTTLKKVMDQWRKAGVPFRAHPVYRDCCLVLGRGKNVINLPGWEEGWFAVQDPSTLLPVDLLGPQPGERILDACCAPGGKLGDMVDRMGGKGRVVGLEADGRRLKLAEENVRRLGLEMVVLHEGDATDPAVLERVSEGQLFDAALIDAPCTNTGVLRRRADARWRFDLENLARMVELQERLLESVSSRVRPGGRLVYATCSLEPEEGGHQVRYWLKRHPDWQLVREIRWYPGEQMADGVYAALLVRSGDLSPLAKRK